MRIKEVYKLNNGAGIKLPKWVEEVYSKKDSPYFFTKLNDDEFMLVDTSDLLVEDIPIKFKRFIEKEFLGRKITSNDMIGYNNKKYFFIATRELSLDDNSKCLQAKKGCKPLLGISIDRWEELCSSYFKGVSYLADIKEYYLLLLRLLKDGKITEAQIYEDSSKIGHYRDSKNPTPSENFEKSGQREYFGLSIFGNTCKIVTNKMNFRFKYAQVGGDAYSFGKSRPLGYIANVNYSFMKQHFATGLLVLRP